MKTHCPQGHEYTEANTYRPPKGGRMCRHCRNAAAHAAHKQKPVSQRAARKRWSEKNPTYYADRWLMRAYKLTREEHAAKLAAQNNKCAICERVLSKPHVDHDHNCCSGRTSCGKCLRDVLCFNCNQGLGQFMDDPLVLEKALAYLKRWASCLA
jgi:hypothetical protein